MQNRESKRAAICGVSLIALSESTVTNVPGVSQIKVSGIWDKMKFSSADLASSYLLMVQITRLISQFRFLTLLKRVRENNGMDRNLSFSSVGLY